MLIINADDWGRSVAETDAALTCYRNRRITSVSAMVFMEDSERAAELAEGDQMDVGLHLNFTEPFTAAACPEKVRQSQHRIVRFLKRSKHAQLIYNPWRRKDFAVCLVAQMDEFERLYGKTPTHVDGHHHMHLCANVVLSRTIPDGVRMRRNFSFWPGEKSLLNRMYRALQDRWISRRYRLADYFFDLTQSISEKKLERIERLARSSTVELMTHPVDRREAEYLIGQEFEGMLARLEIGGYAPV
jgi:chitin disaccharide deacetylase